MTNKTITNLGKKSSQGLGKALGSVSKIFGLLDTVDIVSKVTDSTIPIIDKALDRRHEKQSRLIRLDNLIHMDVLEAKAHLENQGFTVSTILAKPSKAYQTARLNEVVAMSPKGGNLPTGSLIKLYYINQEVIDESKLETSLPDVTGIALDQAQMLLENQGFTVVLQSLPAKKELATMTANTVLAMSPRPNVFQSTIKTGGIIKLSYLEQDNLLASQELAQISLEKQAQRQQKVLDSFNQVGQLLNRKK
ncbi:PASTA domain-containing protein [Streptococcus cuniculipharyngis]|uniref:PASTA domain-containing protein n=1 Tax=Streptococcus cuniculipharyngis TaxID=1562651 RepID=UPI001648031F|nr:PASTA domain-containing protein [Streptococcus cuniculipharyngis]